MDGSLHLTVPSIKPSLHHFQFCRFGLSLGISILSIALFYELSISAKDAKL
jgi:hypothetical protein